MDSPKKILVVDDETGIRSLLSDLLSSKGFDVTLAKDGQDSLDLLGKNDFDLVITDIHMPRVDGIEMLQHMEETGRKEKIIFMTGDLSDGRLSGMRMPRVIFRLQKPFRLDYLLNLVNAAVSKDGVGYMLEPQCQVVVNTLPF